MTTAFDAAIAHPGGELASLDEAEVRVGAFVPPLRVGRAWALSRAPLTSTVFVAAAERLRERGLGSDRPWVQEQLPGTMCPEGAWRAFVDHAEKFTGTPLVVVFSVPDGTDEVTRLIPGRHQGHPLTTAELLVVPPDAGDEPLPVRIRLGDPSALAHDLVTRAFAVRSGRLRIVHAGGVEEVELEDGHGQVEVPGRFGRRASSVTVGPDQVESTLDRLLAEAFREVVA